VNGEYTHNTTLTMSEKNKQNQYALKLWLTSENKFVASIILVYLFVALLATLSSSMDGVFRGQKIDILDAVHISFYFFCPVVVWGGLLPVMGRLARRFPIMGRRHLKTNVPIHLLIAILAAPLIRMLAIILDFCIKSLIGLIDVSPWSVIAEVWHVSLTSAPGAFYTYWLILIAYSLWLLYRPAENKPSSILSATNRRTIKVRSGEKTVVLPLEEVYWISVDGNYVQFHLPGQTYRKRGTLSAVEKQLNPDCFFRIHRSAIVSRTAVQSWQHWRRGEYLLCLKNEKRLTSSRGYHRQMLRLIRTFETE